MYYRQEFCRRNFMQVAHYLSRIFLKISQSMYHSYSAQIKKNNYHLKKLVNSKIKKVQIYSNTGFIEKARYLDDYYLNKIFQVTRNEDLTLDEKSKK